MNVIIILSQGAAVVFLTRKLNHKQYVFLMGVFHNWTISRRLASWCQKKKYSFLSKTSVHCGKCFNLERLLKFETPQERCQVWFTRRLPHDVTCNSDRSENCQNPNKKHQYLTENPEIAEIDVFLRINKNGKSIAQTEAVFAEQIQLVWN